MFNKLSSPIACAFVVISAVVCLLAVPPAKGQVSGGVGWQPVPIITAAMRRAGIRPGGEGGQGIRALVVSVSEPDFLILGTDVGGVYRSLDGGAHWQVCMVGWDTRGANAFAIDPKNARRIVGVGGNSMDWNPDWGPSPNGLYLSTDQGASWQQTLPAREGNEWRAESLAFDPTSYDPKLGYCTVVYWSSRDDGLYRSRDGGATWARISQGHNAAPVKVHSTRGYVYLADSTSEHPGLYRSEDGGTTFRRLNDAATVGLDVVPTRPDSLVVTRPQSADKVWVSDDCGVTFRPAGLGVGLPPATPYMTVKVSPLDSLKMIVNWGGEHWYDSFIFSTTKGGERWWPIYYDPQNHVLPFLSYGNRSAYSPKSTNVVYSTQQNGTVVRSDDGGVTFHWHSNGLNTVMLGASFGFYPARPNAVFLSFQDFEGAVTRDGGRTWDFTPTSTSPFGGWEYGGFTRDGQVLWSAHGTGWGGPRTLAVSRDGGKTWVNAHDATGKEITFTAQEVGYADPAHDGVCFEANYRSGDGARTWVPMANCDAVYISSLSGKPWDGRSLNAQCTLWGRHGNRVCCSTDGGITWADVTPVATGGIRDVAVDPVRNRVYIASEERVKVYELGDDSGRGKSATWQPLDTPLDQRGNRHIWSVCVDPQEPSLVYAGGPANIYATSATVVRSRDAGRTWENLTVTRPLASAVQPGGPHEVEWVRVHPGTRELWAAGECYGMWRLPAPR